MIRTQKCEECKSSHQIGYTCDYCHKTIQLGLPILIEFGFGHIFDGTKSHFCSTNCAIKYLEKIDGKY